MGEKFSGCAWLGIRFVPSILKAAGVVGAGGVKGFVRAILRMMGLMREHGVVLSVGRFGSFVRF
jgi:hypothetical protein